MQVKRYRAASMAEALDMIKTELGDEAVILKSEKIPNPNIMDLMKKELIEVIAATEGEVAKPAPKNPPAGGGRLGYFTPQPVPDVPPKSNPAAFSDMLNQRIMQAEDVIDKVAVQQRSKPSRPSKSKQPAKKSGARTSKTATSRSKQTSSAAKSKKAGATMPPKQNENTSDGMSSLRSELQELRMMVNTLSSRMPSASTYTAKEFERLPQLLAQEMIQLLENGVEKQIATDLVNSISKKLNSDTEKDALVIREHLVEEMTSQIKTAGPIECKKGKTKVIALVGPTGSGKTSTLAKLAANSKFTVNKKVALISADTYRVSALEHLSTFAGFAQLPISAVYSPQELKATLTAHQDKDLIFIDTAGRSPRDEKHLLDLKSYMEAGQPDEIHLVLPVNMKNSDLAECIQRFGDLKFNRLIFTKIDETGSLGSVYNFSTKTDCPISYITTGQTIPDDIKLANSQALARLILRVA